MKIKTKFIITAIIIIVFNLLTIIYIYFLPKRSVLIRYIAFLAFYYLQFSLLYYAIRLANKVIFLFPFLWGIGIWRIIFNLFFRVRFRSRALTPIFTFLYVYITEPFWAGDYFPMNLEHMFHLFLPRYLYTITPTDPIKILMNISGFLISIHFAIKYRNHNQKLQKDPS
nr:hypothetical protein [uncultured Eisenbergiella sp.]